MLQRLCDRFRAIRDILEFVNSVIKLFFPTCCEACARSSICLDSRDKSNYFWEIERIENDGNRCVWHWNYEGYLVPEKFCFPCLVMCTARFEKGPFSVFIIR